MIDRAYSHDNDFKNASLENIALEDGWDWMGDWKKINAGEGWEYGVSWNGEYYDNKAGKFVRQRLWVRKAVKLMRDN